jgi:hypothetical protein
MSAEFHASLERNGTLLEGMKVEVWSNDLYEVIVRRQTSGFTHLSIKRHDRGAVIDWRHLWQLKTEICGAESEGCELYPAASRLVDASNQRHLWVLPNGQRFPFGYDDRLVLSPAEAEERAPGSRQRPWQEGLTPDDDPA